MVTFFLFNIIFVNKIKKEKKSGHRPGSEVVRSPQGPESAVHEPGIDI